MVLTNYLFTDDLQYRYRVEGRRTSSWTPLAEQSGQIRLMNLGHGYNRLRIEVLDRQGRAVLAERVLTLYVRPPWYFSTTAFVVYIALLSLMIVGVVYLENRRLKRALRAQEQRQYEQFRQDIEDCLQQHLTDSELDIQKLCRELGMSRTRLFGVFRDIYGMTPQQLIADRRLQTAAEWLIHRPQMNISEVAYDLGFQSPKYFASCFKERYGMTPTQYRKQSAHGDG